MLSAPLEGYIKWKVEVRMDRTYIENWCENGILAGKISYRDERGFTMLEILVSVAIMAIAVVPLLGLLTSAPVLHQQREQQMRAAFLAQLRLEEVKQKITVGFDNDYDRSTDPLVDDFPAPDATFRYTITDDPDTSDVDNLKVITVEVWYDMNGDGIPDDIEQKVELKTKVARRRSV